ncbi:unnamed protein product [Symbiodinium microadriaticum]|nr:unnamed protein product [Symbiodinium microadriaticum]
MYRDIAKAEHVGSLRMLYQTGREIDHSPYVGVRVGEASHPGPSGGGSRATARRRAENGDEGENDFGDLASILKPMIAAMIKEGVDHAWTTLSDAAEALLRAPGAHGCRRSTRWRPSAQLHPRSKAAPKRVQLVVAGLRRLEWRLRQLARAPGFGKLHDKAASQMHDMLGACPWLAEIPYFEMEQWADFVADRVISWIPRREKVEMDRPILASEGVATGTAIHPTQILKESETRWMQHWGHGDSTGRVPSLLRSLPVLPEIEWQPTFDPEELRKAGKAMAAKVPELWRRGRVVMIAKATSGFRPLTVLSCAWRVGARLLRGWVDTWASHRVLGGVHRRGVRDSFLRILDSLDTEQLYVQEDLSKYFDSIRRDDLEASLQQLGAPRTLVALVADFLGGQRRVFTQQGFCGVVMALWSQFVEGHEAQLVQTVSVVDDRLVWAASPATLASAMRRSSDFDSACGFRCDPTKCRFAHPSLSDAVRDLAAALGYEEMDRLSILGLVIPLDRLETPSLRDFDLLKARRRLRLIAVAAHGLHQKRRLMGILVVPMLCWAGGYASVAENTLEALLADFRWLWHKDLAADTPPVLCYEIADWEVHPGFARDLAALRCAVGLLCRTPVWLDGASLRLVGRKWPTLLPCTVTVLEDLGWWCDLRGAFVHRRDSYGQVRSFEVGVDNFDILTEWLRDVYRRRGLRRCGRGHRWAWGSSNTSRERRCALVTGCSAWHKHKKMVKCADSPPDCLCGGRKPSPPHLLCNCSCRADLVESVRPPRNRLEVWPLAHAVPEVPRAPVCLYYDDMVSSLAEELDRRLAGGGPLFIATDGSLVDMVVEGLLVVALALGQCQHRGTVHILADCQAALSVVDGGGRIAVHMWWVLGGTFSGTITAYNKKFGWGFILPDNVEELPEEAQIKIAEASQQAVSNGKDGQSLLYFRKPDITEGCEADREKACTFSLYVDDKGAGALEVTC